MEIVKILFDVVEVVFYSAAIILIARRWKE